MYPSVVLTEPFVCILKLKSWIPSARLNLLKKKELRRHFKSAAGVFNHFNDRLPELDDAITGVICHDGVAFIQHIKSPTMSIEKAYRGNFYRG